MAEGKRLLSPTAGFHGVYSHSTLNTLWHLGSRKWGRLCEPLSTNTRSHPGPPSIPPACLIGTGEPWQRAWLFAPVPSKPGPGADLGSLGS